MLEEKILEKIKKYKLDIIGVRNINEAMKKIGIK